MKVSDVSTDDCRNAARLINLLQIADFEMTGKDMCSGADALRWLQQVAVEMAKAHQSEKSETPAPAAPEVPAVEPPPAEGFKVKSYNPGKSGKK